jgi:V8-like Glu-specific endopeptidase
VPISPWNIARSMRVNFDYQVDGKSGKLKPGVPFPVVSLLEYRNGYVDYALVKLGRGADGRKPGDVFGHLNVATSDLEKVGEMLCIIQHPMRREKKIEAGPLLEHRVGRLAYDSIDTAGGSSGSPILSEAGEVVGVHLKGGCHEKGGFNSGAAIGAIRSASLLL